MHRQDSKIYSFTHRKIHVSWLMSGWTSNISHEQQRISDKLVPVFTSWELSAVTVSHSESQNITESHSES